LFGDCDFSIYEGMKLKGWPRYTMSRGKIIQKDGEITAPPGHGRFIERSI
jgi:dihydropyrimidinase